MDVQRILAAQLPRAEHVQADARGHGRQPAAQILDVAHVGAAQPEPRFLDRIVGVGHRPQHPIGDRPQVLAVRFEMFDQPVRLVHDSSGLPLMLMTRRPGYM
jgi:hypothetical protein